MLWGRRPNDEFWDETVLVSSCPSRADINKVIKIAKKDGWKYFRVVMIDEIPERPDFVKTVKKR